MRDLKKLFLVALGLTFLGGFGIGGWVGTLLADPPRLSDSVERRAADWRSALGLSASQFRRVKEMIVIHDWEIRQVRARGAPRIEEDLTHDRWRRRILDEVLTAEQRRRYEARRRPARPEDTRGDPGSAGD